MPDCNGFIKLASAPTSYSNDRRLIGCFTLIVFVIRWAWGGRRGCGEAGAGTQEEAQVEVSNFQTKTVNGSLQQEE